jgi:hypothetical protein
MKFICNSQYTSRSSDVCQRLKSFGEPEKKGRQEWSIVEEYRSNSFDRTKMSLVPPNMPDSLVGALQICASVLTTMNSSSSAHRIASETVVPGASIVTGAVPASTSSLQAPHVRNLSEPSTNRASFFICKNNVPRDD